jgi:hypothetical protein
VLIFFDLIKEPMRQLPTFISSFIQLLVSMRRIQTFIDSDELDIPKMIDQVEMDDAISIQGHSFSWGVKNEEEKDDEKKEKKGKKDKKNKEKDEVKILEEDQSIALD